MGAGSLGQPGGVGGTPGTLNQGFGSDTASQFGGNGGGPGLGSGSQKVYNPYGGDGA